MLDADRWPWARFIGPFLVSAGGLVAAVGSWLNWFRIRRRLPGTPVEVVLSRGFANIDGKLTFVFAVIAVAAGVLIFYFSTRRSYLWLGVVALIAGLWIAGLSTFDAATPRDRYVDAAAAVATEQGVPREQAVTFFRQLVDTGVVTINLQLGIFLVIAGGIGVILGSVASILTRPAAQEEEPVAEEPEEEYDYLSDEAESVYEPE
ncbi:MAG TPA: hypothetical protein VHI54_01955 [Actinomycetota bacterium]|nr:hypothetical protein [Actinomycetota bacterium]